MRNIRIGIVPHAKSTQTDGLMYMVVCPVVKVFALIVGQRCAPHAFDFGTKIAHPMMMNAVIVKCHSQMIDYFSTHHSKVTKLEGSQWAILNASLVLTNNTFVGNMYKKKNS